MQIAGRCRAARRAIYPASLAAVLPAGLITRSQALCRAVGGAVETAMAQQRGDNCHLFVLSVFFFTIKVGEGLLGAWHVSSPSLNHAGCGSVRAFRCLARKFSFP